MTATLRPGKSALDEFLPEYEPTPDAQRIGGASHIDAADIHLDPIEALANSPGPSPQPVAGLESSKVQVWPMLAAALVAIGTSVLALAAFGRFGHP